MNVASSRLPWWCRCTARWKVLRFIGYCTCSLVPSPGAAAAGRAGRWGVRELTPGFYPEWAGAGCGSRCTGTGLASRLAVRREPSRPFILTLKLEGVPLPVPADARERGAGRSGKAVVTDSTICCKLRVFSRISLKTDFKLCSLKYVGMLFALF